MKLWILGKGGLLGSALVELCEKERVPYVATCREEADLTSVQSLQGAALRIQPTHVINCAAYTDVDRAQSEPEKAHAVNALGVENLARVGCGRTIHISTDYVFDGNGDRPYEEDDATHPVNAYGQSKRCGEERLLALCPQALVVRTSWVFGKGGKNYLSSLVDRMRQQEVLRVEGAQRSRVTYAPDLARALLQLLDCSGIVHFANGGIVSRYEVAFALWEQARRRDMLLACKGVLRAQPGELPAKVLRPRYSALSTRRFEQWTTRRPRHYTEALAEWLDC